MSAIQSPAIDPTPVPGVALTLLDLYQALDWSGIKEREADWLATSEQVAESAERFTAEPDFQAKFRMVLLDEALHGEDEKRRYEAQLWLKRAGVWYQLLRYYQEHGLLIEEELEPEPATAPEKLRHG